MSQNVFFFLHKKNHFVLDQIANTLQGRKVETVAFVLFGNETELNICGPGQKVSDFLTNFVTLFVVDLQKFHRYYFCKCFEVINTFLEGIK